MAAVAREAFVSGMQTAALVAAAVALAGRADRRLLPAQRRARGGAEPRLTGRPRPRPGVLSPGSATAREDSGTRPPGRPRSTEADEAILRAALELLAEDGYRALTMERVRERSGVGKATLYRRYGSKEELVRAAIVHLNADVPLPDTGALVSDFAATATTILAGAARTGALTLMPRLLSDVTGDPEMHALFYEHLVEPRRKVVRTIVERAQARGEIRADVDPELAIDLMVGPFIYRVIIAGGDVTKIGNPAESS